MTAAATRLWVDAAPDDAQDRVTVILAHGTGAGAEHEFLGACAAGLAARGVKVVRFEFPYMTLRRKTGGRRPPDRFPALCEAYRAALDQVLALPDVRPERLLLAGKSMGGRVAVALAADDALPAAAVAVLGYPFHAAGRPPVADDRLQLLHSCRKPLWIAQGERDPMGERSAIETVDLPSSMQLHWCADGDHSLSPRKRSGRTFDQNLRETLDQMVVFARQHTT